MHVGLSHCDLGYAGHPFSAWRHFEFTNVLCGPFFEARSTGGQVNDCTKAIDLPGERQAEAFLTERGYDSDAIVEHIQATRAQENSIQSTIKQCLF
jgi:hypothetical protein